MERILIIDDEIDITNMIAQFLRNANYEALIANDSEKALKLLSQKPDLILLDVTMPKLDGLELCRMIRHHIDCPIVFLTARVDESDKIKGFAAGGDDYILKPFSLLELKARIDAHLRREKRRGSARKIRFDAHLIIDYDQHIITLDQKPLTFAKKEWAIIELLSQNPGMIFSKERIYETIWGYDASGDSAVVAEHIRRIRAKLALNNYNYIETIWGCGYKWQI